MCMPPAAAHIEAHEPKPSQSTDVYAQYSLLKLLVGFKYVGGGVVKYAPKGQFGASAHDFCALSAGATAPPQGR